MDNGIITGVEAVNRMRVIRGVEGESFGVVFLSYSRFKEDGNGTVKKYERCRLRTAQRSEGLSVNSDHYLYFTDLDTGRTLQCWRKLIRQVRLGDKWYRVNWFQDYE